MYAYIKGELAETNPDHIVIETGGIGYQVFISGQTFEYLPAVGEEIKVYTYLYLREDAMILYGFLTKDDLELFKLLISVSGIGPKGGLAILSALSADDLRFAVLSGDSKAISKAPGVGAKTAQRVILELKDKLAKGQTISAKGEAYGGTGITVIPENKLSEASAALAVLGYSQGEINLALKGIDLDSLALEEIIKQALKKMMKG